MSAIITVPNPILRQKSKPVKEYDRRVQDVASRMLAALLAAKNPEGVGLAAPQIGVPLRMFLMRPTKRHKPKLFINPEIIQLSPQTQSPQENGGVYEGCLSIPNHYAPITRALSVTVRYSFPKLERGNWVLATKQEKFTGFPAHIIQHEMDHLEGKLFVDHCLTQNVKLYKVVNKNWQEINLTP